MRLPEVTTELSDDEFANPEPRWAHKSCCDSIRQVASAKRAAAASEPQRMTLRNAEPKPEREVRPAQGGWSTHDKQGTSGEPSVYWSSIQSGDRRRSLEATGGPGAASCDETLAPWRSEAGGEESAQQISPPTASGVLSEHVQIFAPYQLGGLATSTVAAAKRELNGTAPRAPPSSVEARVVVGSLTPWSRLTAEEARVRGQAESHARVDEPRGACVGVALVAAERRDEAGTRTQQADASSFECGCEYGSAAVNRGFQISLVPLLTPLGTARTTWSSLSN